VVIISENLSGSWITSRDISRGFHIKKQIPQIKQIHYKSPKKDLIFGSFKEKLTAVTWVEGAEPGPGERLVHVLAGDHGLIIGPAPVQQHRHLPCNHHKLVTSILKTVIDKQLKHFNIGQRLATVPSRNKSRRRPDQHSWSNVHF
jgi:hypothetical protein